MAEKEGGERERREDITSGRTPISKLVGKISIDLVHDENEDQLNACSSDGHNDVANGRSEGESSDQGIDSSSHSQTIQQHRQHDTKDNDNLFEGKNLNNLILLHRTT